MKRAQTVILLVTLLVSLSPVVVTAQDSADGKVAPSQISTSDSAVPVSAGDAEKASSIPENYIIQSEDVLRMQVLGEPELAIEQVVDPKGDINLPLMGSVRAKGLTRGQLVNVITQGLSKYLVEPNVQITLTQFRRPKVYVLGFVNRPGMVDFKAGDRVMEAIAQAGSYRQEAYLQGATLTRAGSDQPIRLDLHGLFMKNDPTSNLLLQDGDTIFIPEDIANRYFVLGEVMRPGKYPHKDNVSVVDAISTAGGVTPRATSQNAYIIRGDPRNPQRIKVDVNRFLKSADMSQNVLLLPGDVVYVPETNKPDWNKLAGIISVIVNTSYLTRMWGF